MLQLWVFNLKNEIMMPTLQPCQKAKIIVPTALGTELETVATSVPLPPSCPFLQLLVSVNGISIHLVSPIGHFLFL